MTDHSQFDRTPPDRPGNGRFVVALILGLILGAGSMALWGIYGSAPPKQPQTDVAANASNETGQAIKDLQTTEQKIAGQLQSLQQTIASNHAETKQTFAAEQAETKRLSDQVAALSSSLTRSNNPLRVFSNNLPPPPLNLPQHPQKEGAERVWPKRRGTEALPLGVRVLRIQRAQRHFWFTTRGLAIAAQR